MIYSVGQEAGLEAEWEAGQKQNGKQDRNIMRSRAGNRTGSGMESRT